jgi:hypothetical protein
MIPVFERAKTVHALDRAATVIGNENMTKSFNFQFECSERTIKSLNLETRCNTYKKECKFRVPITAEFFDI